MSNISLRQIKIKPIQPSVRDVLKKEQIDDESSNLFEQVKHAKTELEQIKEQQKQLIDATNRTIQEEKSKWADEKKLLKEQAHKEGYREGFNQGEQQGREQYDKAIRHINKLSHQALEDYDQTIAQAEPDILHIAVNIASKILQHTLKDDPRLFQELVKKAITDIKNKQLITIHVSEQQFGMMLEQKDELMRILEHDSKLSIKLNKDLPDFGCQIEHKAGMLDIGIDTQLNEIRHVLNEFVLENRQ